MKIKGKYEKTNRQFFDCEIAIEKEILHKVLVKNVEPIDYYQINPKENVEFKLYKLPPDKGFLPFGSNYKLEYENSDGKIKRIFVRLNKYEIFRLNWGKKKYWLQKTDNWIKILLPILTVIITHFVTKELCGC